MSYKRDVTSSNVSWLSQILIIHYVRIYNTSLQMSTVSELCSSDFVDY